MATTDRRRDSTYKKVGLRPRMTRAGGALEDEASPIRSLTMRLTALDGRPGGQVGARDGLVRADEVEQCGD
jgi:hypothetical protein